MWVATVLVLALIQWSQFLRANSTHTDPVVAWTFDKHNGTKLIPDFTKDQRFFRDFSPAVLRPGVAGNGLHIYGSQFSIAKDLTAEDCLFDPESCQGVTISLWLNIKKWNRESGQSILKTITRSKDLPGIFFGKGDGAHLFVYIRGSEGKSYEVSFLQSYAWNKWCHLSIKWSKLDQSIEVKVNGSILNENTILGESAVDSTAIRTTVDLIVGENVGPTLMMDELQVYYQRNGTEEHKTPHHTTEYVAVTSVSQETSTVSFSNEETSTARSTSESTGSLTTPEKSGLLHIVVPVVSVVVVGFLLLLFIWKWPKIRPSSSRKYKVVRMKEIDTDWSE